MTKQTIDRAIDRATQQHELAQLRYPDTTSAWAQVLAGLDVAVEYDERIEALEETVARLEALTTTLSASVIDLQWERINDVRD